MHLGRSPVRRHQSRAILIDQQDQIVTRRDATARDGTKRPYSASAVHSSLTSPQPRCLSRQSTTELSAIYFTRTFLRGGLLCILLVSPSQKKSWQKSIDFPQEDFYTRCCRLTFLPLSTLQEVISSFLSDQKSTRACVMIPT